LSGYFSENGGSEVRSFVKIKLGVGRPSLCCFSKDSSKVCIFTPDGKVHCLNTLTHSLRFSPPSTHAQGCCVGMIEVLFVLCVKFSQYQLDLNTNTAPKLVKQDNVLDDLEESPLDEQNAHSPEKSSNTVVSNIPVYLESPRYIMKAEDD
jgi:hypothetical protein